jgi:CRP/FNR family cyclic AMP-dependent transcriptional regulator
MNLHLDIIGVIGLLAACLTFTSDLMKNMLPLRLIALAANLLFVVYYFLHNEPLHMLLHLVLLPVNAKRLWDIHRLVRELKKVDQDASVADWLVPHMERRSFKAGDVLFRKGEPADAIVYIGTGTVRLQEHGETLGAGTLLGEIALFSPDRRRTQTVVCASDGELYRMTDEMLYKLYYMNPKLAFHLIRLIVQRLLADLQKGGKAALETAA